MKVFHWEVLGIVFIFFLGSFLHFTFELSGYQKVVAVVAAVNESVWEHLKLGFWPAVLWALIEYPFLKRSNFIAAKAVSLYVIPLSIVILFYLYTGILGHGSLVLDILIFALAIIAGQFASYKILESQHLNRMTGVCLVAVILLIVAFVVFTFYPPHVFLFEDPLTGGYGILS
ncbi:MAG: hypothetical protein HXS44_11235 [Theionarchaea archaeon]|nr:hypothetical protein [Theionarchaea archaeon]